jgi:hypothetical protein
MFLAYTCKIRKLLRTVSSFFSSLGSTALLVGPWLPIFRFSYSYTQFVGLLGRGEDQPVLRLLPTHRITATQNKCTQTFMPPVEFELTIFMLEQAKTVQSLDRAATIISSNYLNVENYVHAESFFLWGSHFCVLFYAYFC